MASNPRNLPRYGRCTTCGFEGIASFGKTNTCMSCYKREWNRATREARRIALIARGEYRRPGAPAVPVMVRLWEKLDLAPGLRGCWIFRGQKNLAGYGVITVRGVTHYVHHVMYEAVFNASPPKGWCYDHVCHDPFTCEGGPTCSHRACANPLHLAIVSHRANSLRTSKNARPLMRTTESVIGTTCANGHIYEAGSFRLDRYRHIICRVCERVAGARYRSGQRRYYPFSGTVLADARNRVLVG
jgi:hypothetical protein